jgi:magnesium transporter
MFNPLLLPELREMLATHDAEGLRAFCEELHPARTAEFMEGLSATEAWEALTYAELAPRVEIFGFFDEAKQREIIETSDRGEIGQLIAALPPDDRVDLLKEVDPHVVAELLPLIPVDERRDILRLKAYPESTAGALMTTEFARLGEQASVRAALEELGRQAESLETIYYLYVVDDEDHLRGVVSTRQLVSSLGKPDVAMGDLMERDVVTVGVLDDQEVTAEKVARYDLLAIPVVDDERHLLGIITHDDVIDVVLEEATEDVHRLAAVDPLETSYSRTHWFTLARKRGIWLVILFLASLLAALALKHYHNNGDLMEIAWLVFFVPVVISAGGNSGSQSATLVIRALTVGDVVTNDWVPVMLRELLIGTCLGTFLGLIGYGAVFLMNDAGPLYGLIVPVTVVLVVLWGTLSGALLPLLFHRLGLDPALMSNPFVASICDVAGIIIYMQVAVLALRFSGAA